MASPLVAAQSRTKSANHHNRLYSIREWRPRPLEANVIWPLSLEGFFQLLSCEPSLAQDSPESSLGDLLVVRYHEASVGRCRVPEYDVTTTLTIDFVSELPER